MKKFVLWKDFQKINVINNGSMLEWRCIFELWTWKALSRPKAPERLLERYMIVLQNVELQNAELQNAENTKRRITKRRLQNVESYKKVELQNVEITNVKCYKR